MPIFQILSLIVLIQSSFAESLQIIRQKDKIYLTDQSCEKLFSLSEGIKKWSGKTDTQDSCFIQEKPLLQNQKCQIEISRCLPNKLKEYLGKKSENAGPNCFNAALVFSGLLPNLRYSKSEEIELYLKEPLCRKKEKAESPEAGDLGLISMAGKNQDLRSMHAFIYLNEEFVFEKSGQYTTDPYTIKESKEAFDPYDMSSQGESLNKLPYIRKNIDYYKCVSINEYLDNQKEIPMWLRAVRARVEDFDSCFENFIVNGHPLNGKAQKNLIDAIEMLKTYYLQEKDKSFANMNSQSKELAVFLIGSLKLKIDSIYSNIQTPVKPLKYDPGLKRFASELKASYEELGSSRK